MEVFDSNELLKTIDMVETTNDILIDYLDNNTWELMQEKKNKNNGVLKKSIEENVNKSVIIPLQQLQSAVNSSHPASAAATPRPAPTQPSPAWTAQNACQDSNSATLSSPAQLGQMSAQHCVIQVR